MAVYPPPGHTNLPSRPKRLEEPTMREVVGGRGGVGTQPDPGPAGLQLAWVAGESWMSPPSLVSLGQRLPSRALLRPQTRDDGGAYHLLGPGTSRQQIVEPMREFYPRSTGLSTLARSAPSFEAFRSGRDRPHAGVEDIHTQWSDPNVASTLYPIRAPAPPSRPQPVVRPRPAQGVRRPRDASNVREAESNPPYSGESDSQVDKDPYRDALAAEIALAEKTILQAEERLSIHYPGHPVQSLLERGLDESRDSDERLLKIQRKMQEMKIRLERLGRAWRLLSTRRNDEVAEETPSREYCSEINQILRMKDDPLECRALFWKELRLLVRQDKDPSSDPMVRQYIRVIKQKTKEIEDPNQVTWEMPRREEKQQAADLPIGWSGATEAISRRDSTGGSVAERRGGGASSGGGRAPKVSPATSITGARANLAHDYLH